MWVSLVHGRVLHIFSNLLDKTDYKFSEFRAVGFFKILYHMYPRFIKLYKNRNLHFLLKTIEVGNFNFTYITF